MEVRQLRIFNALAEELSLTRTTERIPNATTNPIDGRLSDCAG